MCVVECKGSPKLMRSCAIEAADGMEIITESDRINRARRFSLEMLLSDHTGDCKAPCSLACPAGTDCQGYVGLIANGGNAQALSVIKGRIPLPASIGRVCPHPCEKKCRRGLVEEPISIAALKAYAADRDLESGNIETIDELSFCLEVTDASDYNPLDSTPPITLRADKNNVRSVESGGTTVLEEAGITLTYTGSEGELCEDGAFRFRVENHSERNIWLYTMETYVNGESADLFLFDELAPDAWGKCEMWLYDEGVERVRDITSLELVLGVLDHDTDELLLESKRVSIPVTK